MRNQLSPPRQRKVQMLEADGRPVVHTSFGCRLPVQDSLLVRCELGAWFPVAHHELIWRSGEMTAIQVYATLSVYELPWLSLYPTYFTHLFGIIRLRMLDAVSLKYFSLVFPQPDITQLSSGFLRCGR